MNKKFQNIHSEQFDYAFILFLVLYHNVYGFNISQQFLVMTSSHPTVYYKMPINKKLSKQSFKARTIMDNKLQPQKLLQEILSSQSNSNKMLKHRKSAIIHKKSDNILHKNKSTKIKHKKHDSSITEHQRQNNKKSNQLISRLKNNKKQKQIAIETLKGIVQKMMIEEFSNLQISSRNQCQLKKQEYGCRSNCHKLINAKIVEENVKENQTVNQQIEVSKLVSLSSVNSNIQGSQSQISNKNRQDYTQLLLKQQQQSLTQMTLHKDFQILQHFKDFTLTQYNDPNNIYNDTKQIISNYIAMMNASQNQQIDFCYEREDKIEMVSDLDCIPDKTDTINMQSSNEMFKKDGDLLENARIISDQSSVEQNGQDRKKLASLAEIIKQKMQNHQKMAQILAFTYENLINKQSSQISQQQPQITQPKSLKNQKTISTQIFQPFEHTSNKNQLNFVDFSTIQEILKLRQSKLKKQFQKQKLFIQRKKEQNKLTDQQAKQQTQNIQKWIILEIKEIQKAKKSLLKSYLAAEKIVKFNGKKQYSPKKGDPQQDMLKIEKQNKMIRCLSEGALKLSASKQKNQQIFYEQQAINAIKDAIMNLRQKNMLLEQNLQKQQEVQDSFDSEDDQNENLNDENQNFKTKISQKYDQTLVSDVIQFIFLDLCTEMIKDKELFKSNFKKDIKELMTILDHQSVNKGIPIENRLLIKNFITQFHNFIIYNHQKMLENLNVPLGPSPQQILKYMHQFDENSSNNEIVGAIFPNQLFQEFQEMFISTMIFPEYYRNKQRQQKRVQFLKNCLFINHRAIFDAINEKLDYVRLFGILGAPFPWDNGFQAKKYNSVQLMNVFKESCSKLYKQTAFLCGFIADKQTISNQLASFSEKYLQNLRQDRLNLQISNFVEQNESRWLCYDDDKTEILIQLSQLVTRNIIEQEITFLNQLIQKEK